MCRYEFNQYRYDETRGARAPPLQRFAAPAKRARRGGVKEDFFGAARLLEESGGDDAGSGEGSRAR